jgi:hypothetical protein
MQPNQRQGLSTQQHSLPGGGLITVTKLRNRLKNSIGFRERNCEKFVTLVMPKTAAKRNCIWKNQLQISVRKSAIITGVTVVFLSHFRQIPEYKYNLHNTKFFTVLNAFHICSNTQSVPKETYTQFKCL